LAEQPKGKKVMLEEEGLEHCAIRFALEGIGYVRLHHLPLKGRRSGHVNRQSRHRVTCPPASLPTKKKEKEISCRRAYI